MRRNLLIAALLIAVVCLAAPSFAQSKGVHKGLLLTGAMFATQTTWAAHLPPGGPGPVGAVTTFYTQMGPPAGAWPVWANIFGTTMSADNTYVIVPGLTSLSTVNLQFSFVKYDPAAKAVVGTLWSGMMSNATLQNIANITMNSDGDILTIDNSTIPQAFVVYDMFASTLYRSNLPTGFANSSGLGGLEWDEFNGGVFHSTYAQQEFYKTDYSLLNHTTLAMGGTTSTARFGGTQMDNGDWITGTCCSYRYLKVAWSGASFSTVFTAGPAASGTIGYDVTHEKYAAPGSGVWISNFSPRNAQYLDYTNNTATVIFTPTAAQWPANCYEILPLYNRDLGSERFAKAPNGDNIWNIYINPGAGAFAATPTKKYSYVIAASFAAPKQPGGLTMQDGREIYIGTDPLLFLTVAGQLPPYITGNHGFLDSKGMGVAKLTLPQKFLAINGTAIHFCGAVLDSAAPGGVGWITDPHCFIVNVK